MSASRKRKRAAEVPPGKVAGQRPHRRLHVPAGAAAARRVRRAGHSQPQWRLSLRRLRGAGGRTGHGAGRAISATQHGVFEATHGTAPKYAGLDVINPSSVILCGSMMFHYMGWKEVSQLIELGITGDHKAEAGHLRSASADGRRDQTENQ